MCCSISLSRLILRVLWLVGTHVTLAGGEGCGCSTPPHPPRTSLPVLIHCFLIARLYPVRCGRICHDCGEQPRCGGGGQLGQSRGKVGLSQGIFAVPHPCLLPFRFGSIEVPAQWSPGAWCCSKYADPELLRRGPLQGRLMMLWLCLRGRALSLPGNVNSPGCMLKLH